MTARLLRRGTIAASGGAAGASLAVGSFTTNTSTGTQAITGLDFEPKAVLFWTSGSFAAAGGWQSDIYQSIGMTSGAAESYSVAGASDDAQGSSNTGRRIAAKAVTLISYDGSTIFGEADLSSFDADGFTLDWTSAPVVGFNVMFLAIGGEDVQAKVVNWTSPTTTGPQSTIGAGFEPTAVLHANALSGSIPGSFAGMSVGLGAMDAGGGQWTNALFAQDAAGTSDTYRHQRTDKCLTHLATTVQTEAEFVSMDVDGFTVNFTTATAGAIQNISLCLSGLDAKVGSFAKDTSAAPASQAVTGVGFEPGAVLMTSWGYDEFNHGTVLGDAAWAMGAADGTSERTTAQIDDDNQATTNADSIWKNDKAIALPRTAAATLVAEADLTSMDAAGFTLNWTTNDANTTGILYLALA